MKRYIVEVCRTTGDYESSHKKLVLAQNPQEAEQLALEGESHFDNDEPSGYDYNDDGLFWVNHETIADINDIREIETDTEYEVLKKYL